MRYKNKVIQKEIARANERRENRSGFTSRNYWLSVLFVFIVLPIGTAISVFTEGFNYYHTWAANLPTFYRYAAVLFIALVTNSMVIMLGKGAVDDVQDGVFSGKGYDKIAFVMKAVGFCAFFWFSVSQSLAGAPLFRQWIQERNAPVTTLLEDPDEVNEQFAARRAQQVEIMNAARNTTWRGNITRDAMRAMRTAQAAIDRIDAQIAQGREAVAKRNQEATENYNTKLALDAENATSIAGLGQIVQIFGILFLGLWHTGVEDEAGAAAGASSGSSSVAARPIGFSPGAASAHHPTSHENSPDPTARHRQPIGFKSYPSPHSPAQDDRTNTPDTPSALTNTSADTVATRSYTPNEDGEWPLAAITRLNSFRAYKKEEGIYLKRNTESAKQSLARCRKGIAYEKEQLALMGLKIMYQEKPHRAYVLVSDE